MATVVGVVFQPGGKVYSFDPAGLELRWDENVICQTARGRELGRVVEANHEIPEAELTGPLKRVIRRSAPDDEEQVRKNRVEAKRAMLLFRELAKRHELPLKPLSAEMVFDQSRIVFSYWQRRAAGHAARCSPTWSSGCIGASRCARSGRARVPGCAAAAGSAGRSSAATASRRTSSPITLKMAKDQDLPMNPGRITGLCGRLRCCLAFEHPVYRSFRDRAPAVGRRVTTPQGRGVVRSYEVLSDACMVEMEGEKKMLEVKLDELAEVARDQRCLRGAGRDHLLDEFRRALRAEWQRRGYDWMPTSPARRRGRVQLHQPGQAQAVSPSPALDLRDHHARAARTARRRARLRVSADGARPGQPGHAGGAGRRLPLRDARARRTTRSPTPATWTTWVRDIVDRIDAACHLAAGDRQPLRARP